MKRQLKRFIQSSNFAWIIMAISIHSLWSQESLTDRQGYTAKLFLMSKGLVNDTLKSEFSKLIKHDPKTYNVALIVNATYSERKKHKKSRKIKLRFSQLNFDTTKIKMFDVLKRDPGELNSFDIIYILGGNPFKLLSEIKNSKTDSILLRLAYTNKILMGYSAGMLLLGPNLDLMNSVDSVLGFNKMKLQDLSCLNLYDFLVFPHFRDFTNQFQRLNTLIEDFEKNSDYKIVRLNDKQAIVIENQKVKIIGK